MAKPVNLAQMQKLAPIVARIDAELAKDQDERTSFKVVSSAPPTLKNHLELYKSSVRPDWNGKFQMWVQKRSDYIEFRFARKGTIAFKIVEQPSVEDYQIVENDSVLPPVMDVTLEMDDLEASGELLKMNSSIVFDKSFLSGATNVFLDDPQNQEPTALVLLAKRLGYKITNAETTARFTYGF